KLIIIKSARGKGKFFCLLDQGGHKARMTVPLVDSAVSRQKIIVALALHVPHIHALTFVQHYRQRAVVMRTIFIFQYYRLVAGCYRLCHTSLVLLIRGAGKFTE